MALTAMVFLSACQPLKEAYEKPPPSDNPYGCGLPYELPYELKTQDSQGADAFAWQSFLALSVTHSGPQWTDWNSSVDLIECNQDDREPADGVCRGEPSSSTPSLRYYPESCTAIEGYEAYRVLDQVGKVDDSFDEATSRGLSSNPVIASNGTFLRYEILVSGDMAYWILESQWQTEKGLTTNSPVSFPCPDHGNVDKSIELKLAWMEMQDLPAGLDAKDYFTQEMLVSTPEYRNSNQKASCELKKMGLVGIHLVRKTNHQRAWVWATFEQRSNAPDCTMPPPPSPPPGGQSPGPSISCPETVNQSWNFYPRVCTGGGEVCAPCNTGFDSSYPDGVDPSGAVVSLAQNGKKGQCVNPDSSSSASWCLDLPPATTAGTPKICRQISFGAYYPGATSWDDTPPNAACQPKGTVWANYQLIATQFAKPAFDESSGCAQGDNEQDEIFDAVTEKVHYKRIQPHPVADRPFLGNTSMESYERANCMGCHSKSTVDETSEVPNVVQNGTDFVYFLGLEVPAADDG